LTVITSILLAYLSLLITVITSANV